MGSTVSILLISQQIFAFYHILDWVDGQRYSSLCGWPVSNFGICLREAGFHVIICIFITKRKGTFGCESSALGSTESLSLHLAPTLNISSCLFFFPPYRLCLISLHTVTALEQHESNQWITSSPPVQAWTAPRLRDDIIYHLSPSACSSCRVSARWSLKAFLPPPARRWAFVARWDNKSSRTAMLRLAGFAGGKHPGDIIAVFQTHLCLWVMSPTGRFRPCCKEQLGVLLRQKVFSETYRPPFDIEGSFSICARLQEFGVYGLFVFFTNPAPPFCSQSLSSFFFLLRHTEKMYKMQLSMELDINVWMSVDSVFAGERHTFGKRMRHPFFFFFRGARNWAQTSNKPATGLNGVACAFCERV